MKLLLTGFEPFGGDTINPSWEIVQRVKSPAQNITVAKLQVPTVFGKSIETVAQAIEREHPDAVLCLGVAGGRADLTPERVAINVDDARIPDNAGQQPIDRPIRADGPAAYFSTLPIKAMVQAMREAGVPAGISNTAGTFVCNHLMYGLLDTLTQKYPGVRGGFLHVPLLKEQGESLGKPGLPLEIMVAGIEAAVLAIAENVQDVAASEGKLC